MHLCAHLTSTEHPASFSCLDAIAVDKRRMGWLSDQLTRPINHAAKANSLLSRNQHAVRATDRHVRKEALSVLV